MISNINTSHNPDHPRPIGSPVDMARWHKARTDLGAVSLEDSKKAETPKSIWDSKSGDFAQADQIFKKEDGTWWRWEPQVHEVDNYVDETTGLHMYGKSREEPLTYHGWYGHDTNGGLNGCGWDSRMWLADPGYAISIHGRTFTSEQVFDHNMPHDQMLRPIMIDNEPNVTREDL